MKLVYLSIATFLSRELRRNLLQSYPVVSHTRSQLSLAKPLTIFVNLELALDGWGGCTLT